MWRLYGLVTVGLVAIAGALSPGRSGTPTTVSAQSQHLRASACRAYRLPIKVGNDAAATTVDLAHTTPSTMAALVATGRPSSVTASRRYAPVERTVWSLYAHLTGYQAMANGDYRLTLSDGANHTLTALMPAAVCVGPHSPFRAAMAVVRRAMHRRFVPDRTWSFADVAVHIAGVGFWDQRTGGATGTSNGLELAPVTDLTFDSGPTPTATAVPPPTTTPLPTATTLPTATSAPTSTPIPSNTPVSIAVPSDVGCYETTAAAGLRDQTKGVAVQVTFPVVGVRESDGDLAPGGQVFLFLRAQELNIAASDYQSGAGNFALMGPDGQRYDADNGVPSDGTIISGLLDHDLQAGAENDGGIEFAIPATSGQYTLIWNEHAARPWTRLALIQVDAASRTAMLVVTGTCASGSAIVAPTVEPSIPYVNAPTPTPVPVYNPPPTYNPPPPSGGGLCNDNDNDDNGKPAGRNDYDTNGCN